MRGVTAEHLTMITSISTQEVEKPPLHLLTAMEAQTLQVILTFTRGMLSASFASK